MSSHGWREPDPRPDSIPEDREEPDFDPLDAPEGLEIGVRKWTQNRTIIMTAARQQQEWIMIQGMTPIDRRKCR